MATKPVTNWGTSIHLLARPGDDRKIPVGKTKIGGSPDLPVDFEWPIGLGFLAQVNLREVTRFDQKKLLPGHGMLYFFECTRGGEETGQVIYVHSTSKLRRTAAPEDAGEVIDECVVRLKNMDESKWALPLSSREEPSSVLNGVKLLGCPQDIQDALYCRGVRPQTHVLLFQMEGDPDAPYSYHGVGYFVLMRKQLAARKFGKAEYYYSCD